MSLEGLYEKRHLFSFTIGLGAGLGLGALLWRRSAALRNKKILEAKEGEIICLAGQCKEQVLNAFYGAPDYSWSPGFQKERVFLASAGRDVTTNVKDILAKEGTLVANNQTFGDPAPGREKLLVLEIPATLASSLTVLSNNCEGEATQSEQNSEKSRNRNQALQPAAHYVLRPNTDPRLDKAIYVRYDPALDRKTGAIMIVIPGGNYDESGIFGGEAQPVAIWLTQLGITGVVLQYRCISEGHFWPEPFEDWKECAKAVAAQALDWGCDPNRIGVVGFSAGGHLAAYASLKADAEIKPKLQVLVYPCIDTLTPRDGGVDPWYADQGYPAVEDSIHLLVRPSAPPAFLAGIADDEYCPARENTEVYAKELERCGVPCESCSPDDDGVEHGCGLMGWWTAPCEEWLRKHGWALPVDENS